MLLLTCKINPELRQKVQYWSVSKVKYNHLMTIQQRLKKVVSFRTTSLIIMRMIEIELKTGHILRVQSKKWLRLKYLDQIFPVLYFIVFPDNTEQLKIYLFNRLLHKNWRKNFSWKEQNFLQCDIIHLRLDALEVEILPGIFFSEAAKVAFLGYLFLRTVKNVSKKSHWKVFSSEIGSSNQFLLYSCS